MTDSTNTPVAVGAVHERAGARVHLTGRDVRALMWCGEMYGIRADLLAAMLAASGDVVKQLRARWRRAGLAETGRLGPGPGRRGHVPDGEVLWPDTSPHYRGEVWAVEVELTGKSVARTAGIMAAVLSRDADYGDAPGTGGGLRYARLLYACAPGARGIVDRARASLPAPAAARVEVRDLPAGAVAS